MRTEQQVAAAVADVDGWLHPCQVTALHRAASSVPSGGRIIEVGSFRGRSTIVLARSARPDVEIIAIDPHAGNDRGPQELDGYQQHAEQDYQQFHANLRAAGVAHRVKHLRTSSQEALGDVEGNADLVYIDGAHRFRPARADITDWGNRVQPGGRLVIHDAFSSIGVTSALATTLMFSTRFAYSGRQRTLAFYQRVEQLSAWQRCRNIAQHIAQLPWFLRNIGHKAAIVTGIASRIGWSTEWPY